MSYVDEKIAKVTLDNKAFTKNAEDTIKSLERLKQAFKKAGDVDAAKKVQKEMDSLTQSVGKSVQKSESLLSKLPDVFKKATSNIDLSGASKSVDKMNTDISNKTARTSDILSRLKGIFQKADVTDGFSNSISAVDKLNAKIATINASDIGQAFQLASEQVKNSISIMDIALGNFIANGMSKMMSFGRQFLSGPMDGYAEYVNKMTSIQTIKSNTEQAFGGDTNRQMIQINRTLSDLNEYADQTIYSFEDMTRNIGTFTAAGVGLDDSAVAIKGIANLAAASGSSSMQASTAMYQLSQALASGKVGLMDWNSVVNAGMGGELFKNALYDTADALGVARDQSKSFRDSLQDGWLTSEVLLETLKKFSTNESMIEAATKVKTFSQLIDTTKEAIGSGWSETWEYVFGGLEEAKGLWSDVAKSIGGYLDDNQGKFFDTTLQMERNLGNFRNAMLKTWKDDGGQAAFFEGIKNSVQAVMNIMSSYRDGWRSVMGDYKSQAATLVSVTNNFRDFSKSLLENKNLLLTFGKVGGAIANVVKTIGAAFSNLFSGMSKGSGSFGSILTTISGVADGISSFFSSLRENTNVMQSFSNIGKVISNVFSIFVSILKGGVSIVTSFFSAFGSGYDNGSSLLKFTESLVKVTDKLKTFFTGLSESIVKMEAFKNIGAGIGNIIKGIGDLFAYLVEKISGFGDTASKAGSILGGIFTAISEKFKAFSEKLKPTIDTLIKALAVGDLVAALAAFLGIKKMVDKMSDKNIFAEIIKSWFGGITDTLSSLSDVIGKAGELLESFGKSVSAFTKLINAVTLATIAVSLLILAVAIKKLSELEMEDISKGIIGIASGAIILTKSIQSMSNMIKGIGKGFVSTMIGFAVAILILVKSMKEMSEIDEEDLLKAVGGVAAASGILVGSMKLMEKINGISINPLTFVAFAAAIKILTSALKDIADIDSDKILYSVTSLVAIMLSLSAAIKVIDGVKINMRSVLSLISFAVSVKILVSALKDISDIDSDKILNSVIVLASIMGALSITIKVMNGVKISLGTIASLISAAVSIKILVESLKVIGEMDHKQLEQGLTGLIAVMGSFGTLMTVIGMIKPNMSTVFAVISAAISIYVMTESIKTLSNIEPEAMSVALNGLVTVMATMGILLTAISVLKPNLGSIAGLIAASTSMYIAAQAIKSLSDLSWDGMAVSLTAMAGAMAILLAASAMADLISAGGPAKLILLATALNMLAIPIKMMSTIGWAGLAVGLAALAANLTVLLVAAAIAQGVAPGLMLLSSSLLSIGVSSLLLSASLLLAGTGVMLFAMGIAELIRVGPKLVESIDKIVEMVQKRAPALVVAATTMILMFLKGIEILIPQIVITGIRIVTSLMEGLAQEAPRMVEAAVKMIVAFGESLIANMGVLVVTAVKIATEFVQQLGTALVQVKDQLIPALSQLLGVVLEITIAVLKGFVGPILQALVDIFTPVAEFILNIFRGLSEALAPILMPIAAVIISVVNGIVDILQTIGNIIITTINAISTALQVIGQTIQVVFQSFASVVQSIAFAIVGSLNAIAGIISAVFNGIASVISSVGSAIQSVLAGLGQAFVGFGIGVNLALQGVGTVVESMGTAVKSALEGVSTIVESVGTAIKSALEGVGDVFESVGKGIESAFKGVGNVIESTGEAIKKVLDGLSGVFDSIGNAALNAGKGFDKIADGVSQILKYSLSELVSNLGAVADAIGKMSDQSDGMNAVGSGLKSIGISLSSFGTSGQMAVMVLQSLSTTLPTISTAMSTLPMSLAQAATGFQMFGMGIQNGIIMAIPIAMIGLQQLVMTVQTTGIMLQQQGLLVGQSFGTSIGTGISAGIPTAQMNAMMLGQGAQLAAQANLNPMLSMGIGTQFGQGIGMGIGTGIPTAQSNAMMLGQGAQLATSTSLNPGISNGIGSLFGLGISSGIASQSGSAMNSSSALAKGSVNSVRGGFAPAQSLGSTFGLGIRGGISSQIGSTNGESRNLAQGAVQSVRGGFSPASSLGSQFGGGIASGVGGQYGNVYGAGSSIANAGRSGAQSVSWYSSGSFLSQGLANGIYSMSGYVMNVAANLAQRASNAIKRALDIHSPSRVTYAFGEYFSEGFINGIVSLVGQAVKTSTTLAEKTVDAVSDTADAIESTFDRTLDFNPTITPVVDMSNMDKLNRAYNSEWRIGTNVPSNINPNAYRNQNGVTNSTTNHTNEYQYDINVNVSGSQASNPREIAKAVQTEIKRMNDRAKVGRGEQPIW